MNVHTWNLISTVSSSISFCTSFISLLPQILETFHDKTVDGISPYFLLCWLCADITSLIGALLTKQLVFQIVFCIYFLFSDLLVCGQYYYYGVLYGNKLATIGHETVPIITKINSDVIDESMIDSASLNSRIHENNDTRSTLSYQAIQRRLSTPTAISVTLAIANSLNSANAIPLGKIDNYIDNQLNYNQPNHNHLFSNNDIGSILSWIGAFFYIGARIPQLIRNYQRKSTDGVSPFLFATTLLGNLTYNIGIFTSAEFLLSQDKWKFIKNTMPFIVGSIGPIFFDLIYFYQYYVLYADDNKIRHLEREIVLNSDTFNDRSSVNSNSHFNQVDDESNSTPSENEAQPLLH